MTAGSLFLVLVLAKAAGLQAHAVVPSYWSAIAYVWQDAAVALGFAIAERLLRPRSRMVKTVYGALAIDAAINVPVVRVLSTPLTWAMVRATRGTLADSIWYYATPANLVPAIAVAATAIALPRLMRRMPQTPILIALAACTAAGPIAASRVDTAGLERNALIAL